MIKLLMVIKEKIIKIFKKDVVKIGSKKSEYEIAINEKDEKRDFFELYKNVKNGKIKKEQLLITDLIKINLIMEQEKNFYEEQIKLEERNIEKLDEKINQLDLEKKVLSSKIQTTNKRKNMK